MAISPFTEQEKTAWLNALPSKTCGAGVICINSEGKMLIAKASYKDHWSLPGGVVDENESPKAAAIRELQEETSISISEDMVEFADVVYHPKQGDRRDFVHFLFIAQNINATPLADGHEIIEVKWATPAEFREKCRGATHLLRAADIAEGLKPAQYLEG